jgi:hypothetical protein
LPFSELDSETVPRQCLFLELSFDLFDTLFSAWSFPGATENCELGMLTAALLVNPAGMTGPLYMGMRAIACTILQQVATIFVCNFMVCTNDLDVNGVPSVALRTSAGNFRRFDSEVKRVIAEQVEQRKAISI